MPSDLDTFVHRTGRTGRNGKEGKVYIIADAEDSKRMNKYSKDIGHVKTLNFHPSEIYQLKDLIDKAKEMESESHLVSKNISNEKWMDKMGNELGIVNDHKGKKNQEELQQKKKIVKK